MFQRSTRAVFAINFHKCPVLRNNNIPWRCLEGCVLSEVHVHTHHVYIHTRTHEYIPVQWIYTDIHTHNPTTAQPQIYNCTPTHIQLHTHKHTTAHTQTNIHAETYTIHHKCIPAHKHTLLHTYIHKHIHIHIQHMSCSGSADGYK